MSLPISASTILRIVGGVFITLGLVAWIVAVTSLGSYENSSIAWALLGGFALVVGALLLYVAQQYADEREAERIRSLGVRVTATVTEISERDDNDTGTKAYLHAAWRDPQTERSYNLTSQALPRAIAYSYRPGDPVVVFIDPADPYHCYFEVSEHTRP